MTDKEIFEIAGEHLHLVYSLEGARVNEWRGEPYELLKFAKALYEEGYDQGCFEATGGQ
jgi:hypothetical protein